MYFPDYWSNRSREWWIQECVDFNDVVPFDGVWLVSTDTSLCQSKHLGNVVVDAEHD